MERKEIEHLVKEYFIRHKTQLEDSFRNAARQGEIVNVTISPEEMADGVGLFFSNTDKTLIPAYKLPNLVPDEIFEEQYVLLENGQEYGVHGYLTEVFSTNLIEMLKEMKPPITGFRLLQHDGGEEVDI